MREEEDILRYLNHEMDEEEMQQFTLRMEEDEALRESVLHSQHIRNVLDKEARQFKNQVSHVLTLNRKKRNYKKIWIAASFTVLAITAVYFLLMTKASPIEVALAYQEPYPDVITSRAEGSVVDMSSYNQGDYEEAVLVFEEKLAQSDEPLIRLYLGISYLMLDKNEKAIEMLQLAQGESNQYQADFVWYQSLALIKSERYVDAKSNLIALKEQSVYYREKSLILIESLR